MAPRLATCWGCGKGILQSDDGSWVDTREQTYCGGSHDEKHRPIDDSPVDGTPWMRLMRNTTRQNIEERKKAESSATSYCAGCHSSFPSSQGFPHTQSGETLVYCPRCSDNGEVLGEEGTLSVTAFRYADAPALDLECDTCGEEVDAGDDNDTDPMGGPGDPCMNCSHGKLKFGKSSGMTKQDEFEDSSLEQADDYSALTPDVAQGLRDITNAPRSFKPPRKMMREQVDGLDKMNNGGGMSAMSQKTASYNDLLKHLVQEHGFSRSQWREGYNANALKMQHDQAHKQGTYTVDHEHSVHDYEHNQMITSNKKNNDSTKQSNTNFYQGENQMDNYTTEDFSAGDVAVDFAPQGVPLPNDYMNTVQNDAQQNRQTVDDSRAAWAAEIDKDNYSNKHEDPYENPAQQVYPYQRTAAQASGFRKRQARKDIQMVVVASTKSPTIAGAKVSFANANGKQITGSVLVVGEKEFCVIWDDRKASMEKKSDYQLVFKNPQR